jgi:hypothetical protein
MSKSPLRLAFEGAIKKMRKISLAILAVIAVFGVVLAGEQQAHAYADPGSSLLMLQAAGSAVTAVAIYFRRKIYALFHRTPKTDADHTAPPTPSE